jgi:hypothetical protein
MKKEMTKEYLIANNLVISKRELKGIEPVDSWRGCDRNWGRWCEVYYLYKIEDLEPYSCSVILYKELSKGYFINNEIFFIRNNRVHTGNLCYDKTSYFINSWGRETI